jgi:hypothetical protein
MAIEIDTTDIDGLAAIFRNRALWLVPTSVIKGRSRAERHVRRRHPSEATKRHPYRRKVARHPTQNLIAHYINHVLYLRFKRFWGRGLH